VALVCSPALFAVPAMGVTDKIPASVKTSNSPSHAAVQGFIDKETANLASDDPTTQKLARDQIIQDVEAHAGSSATPQFQTEFANDLGKALEPLLKSPSLRTRINAAVVATEVATKVLHTEGASASGLAPAVKAMLGDSQPAVVLWGVKAAEYVMASDILYGGNPAPIAKQLVKSVEAHGDSWPIIEEAFATLTFKQIKQKGDPQTGPQFVAGTANIIPDLLDLIAWRGKEYNNNAGGNTPTPLADLPATVFLSVTAFDVIHNNPALQARVLKVMGEATCLRLRALANGNSTPGLLDMARADGNAFETLGKQLTNADALQNAGKNIAQMSQNADLTRIGKLCDDLAAALKGVGVDIAAENTAGAEGAPPAAVVAGK
jgi:hypothetical protein